MIQRKQTESQLETTKRDRCLDKSHRVELVDRRIGHAPKQRAIFLSGAVWRVVGCCMWLSYHSISPLTHSPPLAGWTVGLWHWQMPRPMPGQEKAINITTVALPPEPAPALQGLRSYEKSDSKPMGKRQSCALSPGTLKEADFSPVNTILLPPAPPPITSPSTRQFVNKSYISKATFPTSECNLKKSKFIFEFSYVKHSW